MGELALIDGASVSAIKEGKASLLAVVQSYLKYYTSGSDHTSRAKRLDLQHFLSFLANHHALRSPEKLKLQDWDHASTQRFVDELLRRGEAPATVARRLATVKHMGRTLAERLPGFINPAKEVKSPRHDVPVPKALSSREVKAVTKSADRRLKDKDSFIRLRNRTLFDFMLESGLRADEVRLLRMGQLDDSLEWIHNVRTKGRRYRNVYLTSEIRPSLRNYLEARQKELERYFEKLPAKTDRALPVFISGYNAVPGEPDSFLMGAKTIWRAINELSNEVHLHPHLLRHSFAIDLLDHARDVRLVSQALGHSDVRITMRYTERADHEVAEALEASRRQKRNR